MSSGAFRRSFKRMFIPQTRKYKARSHWGKSGLVYHNSESLDLKLNEDARQGFVGKFFFLAKERDF